MHFLHDAIYKIKKKFVDFSSLEWISVRLATLLFIFQYHTGSTHLQYKDLIFTCLERYNFLKSSKSMSCGLTTTNMHKKKKTVILFTARKGQFRV